MSARAIISCSLVGLGPAEGLARHREALVHLTGVDEQRAEGDEGRELDLGGVQRAGHVDGLLARLDRLGVLAAEHADGTERVEGCARELRRLLGEDLERALDVGESGVGRGVQPPLAAPGEGRREHRGIFAGLREADGAVAERDGPLAVAGAARRVSGVGERP